jgi:hypothetical protein
VGKWKKAEWAWRSTQDELYACIVREAGRSFADPRPQDKDQRELHR